MHTLTLLLCKIVDWKEYYKLNYLLVSICMATVMTVITALICAADSCYLRGVIPNIIGGTATFALTVPILLLTFSGNFGTQIHERMKKIMVINDKNCLYHKEKWESSAAHAEICQILEELSDLKYQIKYWYISSIAYATLSTITPWFLGHQFWLSMYLSYTAIIVWLLYKKLYKYEHIFLRALEESQFETIIGTEYTLKALTSSMDIKDGYSFNEDTLVHNMQVPVFFENASHIKDNLENLQKSASHLLSNGKNPYPWIDIKSLSLIPGSPPMLQVELIGNKSMSVEIIRTLIEVLSSHLGSKMAGNAYNLIAKAYASLENEYCSETAELYVGYIAEYLILLQNALIINLHEKQDTRPTTLIYSSYIFPGISVLQDNSIISLSTYLELLHSWAESVLQCIESIKGGSLTSVEAKILVQTKEELYLQEKLIKARKTRLDNLNDELKSFTAQNKSDKLYKKYTSNFYQKDSLNGYRKTL